jgi:hypothetical protein
MKSFYEDWVIEEWITPFSQCSNLFLESFLVLSEIHILLCSSDKNTYWVKFPRGCPFRSIDESNRLGLWELISEKFGKGVGSSWFIRKSDFLDFVDEKNLYYFEDKSSKFAYFISTNEECLEIVHSEKSPPEIKVFANTNPNEIINAIIQEEFANFPGK